MKISLSTRAKLEDLAALAAGCAMPLAFAPFSLFFIALISPTVLFMVWRRISPRRAFWRGWLFGLGQFGLGVSWVYISLYQFGGMPFSGAVFFTLLFIMLMALYPALLGWLVVRHFPDCNRVRLLAVLPAGWVLLEWIRGWLFTGFPWLLLGYTQLDTPLRGLAPFTGVYGVSWAVAFTASLLTLLWLKGWRKRATLKELLPILAGLWLFCGVLGWLSGTEPVGDPLEVAVIQGNVAQDAKWTEEMAAPTVQSYLELSQQHIDADLIVWPETAVPYFSNEPITWDLVARLEFLRAKHQTEFVFGIREYNPTTNQFYNSAFAVSEFPGVYRKRHLVPFGEYVPLRKLAGDIMRLVDAPVYEDFSVGAADQPPVSLHGRKAGIFICYEDAFSREAMRTLPLANFLINISNDGWFGDSLAPHQHLEIARMRALESGRYLIRATNTGVSAIMDSKGRIMGRLPQFERQVLRAQVQPTRGETMYTIAGNAPLLILLFMAIVVGVVLEYFWHLPADPANLRDYPTLLHLSAKKRHNEEEEEANSDADEDDAHRKEG